MLPWLGKEFVSTCQHCYVYYQVQCLQGYLCNIAILDLYINYTSVTLLWSLGHLSLAISALFIIKHNNSQWGSVEPV